MKIYMEGLILTLLPLHSRLLISYVSFQYFLMQKQAAYLFFPIFLYTRVQLSLVAWLCLILHDPMDCSTPGFSVHHQHTEPAQTHVHWVRMPSIHLILCRPLLLLPSIFPNIRVFSNESVLASGGQRIGVSASASVLPMNIQDWFPLGWTGSPFSPRDFQESSPIPQFKSINSLVLSFLYSPTLTPIHDY